MSMLAAAQTVILREPADHTAAILTFIGALSVAVIAAGTAQWRLRTQLSTEEARLIKQLAADDKTHLDQLSFQRGETDRRELRSILDDLAQHLFALQEAASDLIALATTVAAHWTDSPDFDYWGERYEPLADRINDEADEASRQIQRVRLRLGESGKGLVQLAHIARLRARDVDLAFIPDPPWDSEKFEAADKARKQLDEYSARFQTEALQFTRAQLHG